MVKTLVMENLGRWPEDRGGDEREPGTGVAVTLRGRVHVVTNVLLGER